jgi:RNA polymerase sigma-70 factor (ECF subfamily)
VSAPDTDQLLSAAAAGDPHARDRLLERHRPRLRRMVGARLDRRLAARVDPSDVVQDALAEAARRLDRYLADRPLPFYPWLRAIAADRLADLYRRHGRAGRRAVGREEVALPLADRSALELAERLFAGRSGPATGAEREELRERVRVALAGLKEADREVLVMRHLEQMPAREIAAVLGTTEGAVHVRHLRALRRLRELLGEGDR